jgi:hypothetical protein
MPPDVDATGIEIDPVLAAAARASTGREIIVGDVLELDLPPLDAVVGNPPFQQIFVEQLFGRMHRALVDGGRMVLLLSAHLFQTSVTVARYADSFALDVELLPRDVYPRLRLPLVVATMRKVSDRRIIGIAFAREVADLRAFPAGYRLILQRSRTNVYVAACKKALRATGRPATIEEIAQQVEGARPTRTEHWRAAIRRALQESFVRVAPATYALPEVA